MNNNEKEDEKFENLKEDNDSLNDEKKKENELEDPIYVMTVELEKGKSESIKIYPNSKPDELAFSFCKKYNLDFSSLSYLSTQIKNLIDNLSNGNENNENNNEPIEEVDEENSEIQSKKFASKSNSANLSPGLINTNKKEIEVNPKVNNYYYNLFQRKINNEKGIELNTNENKSYTFNSLFNRFEYKNYFMERFNKNKNNNNENKENKNNIKKFKNKTTNKNINNSIGNVNNESKNNTLSNNINFYKKRENIVSYERFFDEMKNNIINKTNKEKDIIRQDSYNKKVYSDFETENNILNKNKDFISEKKINKTLNYDGDLTIMKNKKNFDLYLNNCNLLDEIYQNKVEDVGIFLNKNHENNNERYLNTIKNSYFKQDNNFKINENDKIFINNKLNQLKGSNSFLNKSKGNNIYSLTNTPNQQNKKLSKSIPKIKNTLNRNKNEDNSYRKNYQNHCKNNNVKNNIDNYKSSNLNKNKKIPNQNDIIYNQNIDESFKKLFKIFDSDKDGSINILSMETKTLPITIFNILNPLIESIKNKNNDITESEFINLGKKIFSNLSFNERRSLLNYINKI